MHDLKTIARLNRFACEGKPRQNPLRHHPRIQSLREFIGRIRVDCFYKAALHRSLDRYARQFVARPEYKPEEGWDNLEALQQVTLGDLMEESSMAMCEKWNRPE